jgi:hypothetical protein
MPKKKKKPVVDELTPERVRGALIQLAQLGVAFEGQGLEFPPSQDPEAKQPPDDAALRCLTEVVGLLESHRVTQQQRLRKVVGTRIHGALKSVYKKLDADPEAVDLDREVDELFAAQGLQVTDEDRTEMVVELQLVSKLRPDDAAAKVVGARMSVAGRTIYNWRKQTRELARVACPLDWHRWVPLRLARRYADEAIDRELGEPISDGPPLLDDIKELRPEALRKLARAVEAMCKQNIVETVHARWLADLGTVPPAFREEVRADREAARATLRDALRSKSLEETELEEQVSQHYRAAVERLTDAYLVHLGLA